MISQLCCTYRNHVVFPKKTKNKKQTHKQTTTKQTKTATTYNIPCLNHKWRCYHALALNGQQVGPTFLALLSYR